MTESWRAKSVPRRKIIFRFAYKLTQQKIFHFSHSSSLTFSPTHNFATSNMSKNPSNIREREEGRRNMKKRHTFIDFCSSRVLMAFFLPHFPFLSLLPHPLFHSLLRHTTSRIFFAAAASIIHTFFRYVTRAWAHRKFFYELLLLWIDDMPSLSSHSKILSLQWHTEEAEKIFGKYLLKIFALRYE
jgi:hypothetical protein